ncbi:MAG TPA: ATP-binding protein [Nocardioidaceae bacterium]|nr:ATP-binding protein [Nocardioidaceae bacterium]
MAAVLTALAVTVIVSLVGRNIVRDQEQVLLGERARELSTLLTSTISSTVPILHGAGLAAASGEAGAEIFQGLAATTTVSGSRLVVVEKRKGSFAAIASAGEGAPAPGDEIDPDIAVVVERALTAKGMVTGLVEGGGGRRIILALAVQAAAPTVAYIGSPLAPPTPAPVDADSPYSELNVAIYAGAEPDESLLMAVSGDVPDTDGDIESEKFAMGADSWLLVISPRQPLVGSLAVTFPWVVLGLGILLALLLGVIVEILARRGAYAMRLVEERTHDLEVAKLAAEQANDAKSEFLSRMSHELRTPLNAVLGFGQLLEIENLSAEQSRNVAQITRGGRHLLDLVNEILDINQIESGLMSLSPEPVLVGDVLREAAALVRPLAAERSVNLDGIDDVSCDKFIRVDRQRLKQVILNLLSNAIKYNRHGGSVSVTCLEAVPGKLRIQVTDDGPGIPEEKLDLLFAPFERLGAEQTGVEGTGIGLVLSRGLTEAMGGTLGLESTMGRGSTFWVEFMVVEPPVGHGQPVVADVRPVAGDALTVLHIEDNQANAELVERVLAQRPAITVIPAMRGRVGLELARKHRPSLILLDLNLGDITGFEVLQILRQDPATSNIPVAIISADAMPRQIERLLSSGAIDYLTKPIDIGRLLALVDDVFKSAGTEA